MFFILSDKSFASSNGASPAGPSDRALNFYGNDTLDMGVVGFDSKFTIEAWINPSDFSIDGYIYEFNAVNSIRIIKATNGSIRIEHKSAPATYYAETTPGILVANTWTHVAITIDTSLTQAAGLYINGSPMGLSFYGGKWPVVNAYSANVSAHDLYATIDEFRVWNTVRSAFEISSNYSSQISNPSSVPNFFRYYQFDEGVAYQDNTSITNLTDASGSSINADWHSFVRNGTTSNIVGAGPPIIYTTNTILDEGTYIPPTPTPASAIMQNTGSSILTITSAVLYSGVNYQLITTGFPINILPGNTTNIDFQFNPVSPSGSTITDSIFIYSNDGTQNPYKLSLTGSYPGGNPTTTWDGTSWDNGTPTYGSTDAVINGNYTGSIFAANLTINPGFTVTLATASDILNIQLAITNNGIINAACVSGIPKTIGGSGILLRTDPVITPTVLPDGATSTSYNQILSMTQGPGITWNVINATSLPPGLGLDPSTGIISGIPTAPGTYNFTVGAIINSTLCGDTINLSINVTGVATSTTWNGSTWSGGAPTSTLNAIINGNYNTSINGSINCDTLKINSGTLKIVAGTSVIVSGDLNNTSGIVDRDCEATFTYNTVTNFGTSNYNSPYVITTSVPNGVLGNNYNAALTVSQLPTSNWSITSGNLPPGINLSGATLIGIPTTIGAYTFYVKAGVASCTTSSVPITLVVTSLPDPNLTVNNLSKTFGDPAFNVKTFSASNGPITYSLIPANGCATIDANSGLININCAGPISQITVQAVQHSTTYYGTDTATATLFLFKAVPFINIDNVGILLGDTSTRISYTSNSDGVASYVQVTHDTSVAKVSSDGKITTFKEGTFVVTLTLSSSDKYLSLSEEITLQVFSSLQPPKANPDSVNILVGQDTTFNILANDIGYTGKIVPELTDIDLDNAGVQIKYFDPKSGTYLISATGDLTFNPSSAVGTGTYKISYTITDTRGKVSEPALVTISIKQPGPISVLKATQLFTPNGDGLNDVFLIGFTDNNKKNYLKLYDRSGYEVYSENDYKNDWGGTLANGKSIEDGIYYFIYNENDGEREAKGIIQIKR